MHVNCTQLDWQVRLGRDLPQDLDLDSGLGLSLPLLGWVLGVVLKLARHQFSLSVKQTVFDIASD